MIAITPSLPGSPGQTLESSVSNDAEPSRQTLDLSFSPLICFVNILTVSLQVLYFKGLRVWDLRACSYCMKRRKTTGKGVLLQAPRWTALSSQLKLQAVDSNPSFTTS